MAEESCLVLVKPDGLIKSLTGNIITSLSETKLKIIGAKIVSVKRELAETHYHKLKEEKGEEIFEEVLKYIMGEYHTPRVLALIYKGENAIEKIRTIAGKTNPEEADPTSIRGRYGRVHSKTGVFENGIHASDSPESAEKEIKLWFAPEEIVEDIYPIKEEKEECEVKKWA
ncbi:nucleoside-diphosphate kinase [archaeon]|jgi:nucleoside-diphosphate kinase|nr:nucleoside-diphosphate kinase [archaeon]MBT3577613.1 nucleoside-diphosphate kinase [archaeon]MBT6820161.1 nucleoside-diphosphate kinase [archaeon]MBT6956134.1 nucleoside-diphosphate kinase [archaeon]MBT7025681.1 nucleoside-diphosphate kinase [archaeon]